MIKDINTLLIIQKFFYGHLIKSSAEIVEVKCFISSCDNRTKFDFDDIYEYSNMNDIVIGLKNFDKINTYYIK